MQDVAERLGVRSRLRSQVTAGQEGITFPIWKKHCGRKGLAHCWKKPYTAEQRTRVAASF